MITLTLTQICKKAERKHINVKKVELINDHLQKTFYYILTQG